MKLKEFTNILLYGSLITMLFIGVIDLYLYYELEVISKSLYRSFLYTSFLPFSLLVVSTIGIIFEDIFKA